MSKVDLHTHSAVSLDGEYAPAALVEMCVKNGVELFALSDHNATDGVAEAIEAGRRLGVCVIPAVELDCEADGVGLHLLGYGIDYTDRRFGEFGRAFTDQVRASGARQLEIITGMGIALDIPLLDSLARDGLITGEMIGEAAMADERNRDNPLITPYFAGGSRSDNPFVNFYWDFCSAGKPAYIPIKLAPFDEAFALIKDAGGAAVIAHPRNNFCGKDELLKKLLSKGVWGLEVYSSYHTADDYAHYSAIADEVGVMRTAGSDFHGKTKPSVVLGGIDPGDYEDVLFNAARELARV